jgi:hypothetical protein
LLDLGFDSLMAVELRNVLRQWLALDQKIPATVVFDHPTIDAVSSYLEPLLPGAAIAAGAADEPRAGRRGASDADARQALGEAAVAELSADEVEAALLRKLAEIEK